MGRLHGKVAVVTGGAQGQGRAHVEAMVREGANVIIADILDAEGESLARELGARALFAHLDVRSDDDWNRAIEFALESFGVVNVLVNNAGVLVRGSIGDVSIDEWNRALDINLTGSFRGIRAALPALRDARPSSIINVSSTAGFLGFPGMSAYNASKFALRGLTRAAAVELAPDGIRVNSIHPGNVQTAMIEDYDGGFDQVAQRRAARADEISPLVVYLASDESSYCTGSEFIIDGGESAGHPVDHARATERSSLSGTE
ncbi:MAG: SDR family oxidoreductase [Microcella sp.]|nr:MAG: SDR family oxidoreductase [Microcella sp.]